MTRGLMVDRVTQFDCDVCGRHRRELVLLSIGFQGVVMCHGCRHRIVKLLTEPSGWGTPGDITPKEYRMALTPEKKKKGDQ